MNTQKLKTALSLGIIQQNGNNNPLQVIRKNIEDIKEAGRFIRTSLIKNAPINRNFTLERYAVVFENLTLDIELISNTQTHSQTIKGFNIVS